MGTNKKKLKDISDGVCDSSVPLERVSPWYFSGLAGTTAALIVHPIETIKVVLQAKRQPTTMRYIRKTVKHYQSLKIFYTGASASMLRQMFYNTGRFGIYEYGKQFINTECFIQRVCLAGISGFFSGILGSPADLIHIRMQYDVMKLRKNYKNVFNGFRKVYKNEGFLTLFRGSSLSGLRGTLQTLTQFEVYTLIEALLKENIVYGSNLSIFTYVMCFSTIISTTLFQPFDVLRTRIMTSKKKNYKGILSTLRYLTIFGPSAFLLGFMPALIRNTPQALLQYIIIDHMRKSFGTFQ